MHNLCKLDMYLKFIGTDVMKNGEIEIGKRGKIHVVRLGFEPTFLQFARHSALTNFATDQVTILRSRKPT